VVRNWINWIFLKVGNSLQLEFSLSIGIWELLQLHEACSLFWPIVPLCFLCCVSKWMFWYMYVNFNCFAIGWVSQCYWLLLQLQWMQSVCVYNLIGYWEKIWSQDRSMWLISIGSNLSICISPTLRLLRRNANKNQLWLKSFLV
jgi:hypothetical protein